MASEIIKLATNIPVVFDGLLYCDFSKTKKEGWSDQLRLTGKSGGKQIAVYVSINLENDLGSRGWIERTGGTDKFGGPAFKVNGQPKFTLLKVEEGTKKYVTIQPYDFQTAGNGQHKAQQPTQSAPGSKPATAPVASIPQPAPYGFEAMEALYSRCVGIARRCWLVAGKPTIPDDLLVSAVATLFIESNKRGLTVLPSPMVGTDKRPDFGPEAPPLPSDAELELEDESLDELPF